MMCALRPKLNVLGATITHIEPSEVDPRPGWDIEATNAVDFLYSAGHDSSKLWGVFAQPDDYLIRKIVELYVPLFAGVSDLVYRFESTIWELMNNVFAHSQSSCGGAIGVQYRNAEQELQFSICDYGITIPAHLSRLAQFSSMTDDELLLESFKIGVSAGDPKRHSGQGLPFLKEMTSELGGRVYVFSRNGVYCSDIEETRAYMNAVAFPGTLVALNWPSK